MAPRLRQNSNDRPDRFGRNHLDDESLLELLDRPPDLEISSPEERHVAKCAHCRKRWRELAGVVTALRGRHLENPPEWLRAWSEDLPGASPRRVPVVAKTLRLSFDSWRLEPAGARAVSAPTVRRLVFRSASVDVDVEIEYASGGKRAHVRGQVLDAAIPIGRAFAAGEVRLLARRGLAATTWLDERGEFALSDVPAGAYSLRLTARGFDCRIPRLEI